MTPPEGTAGDADGFETRAIHAGQDPDPATGAVVIPISLATTFAQDVPGQPGEYEYARSANPTRTALETALASLEGAAHGLAFASGMAAEDTLTRHLRPGDHMVIADDAYGGTYRLFTKVIGPMGVEVTAVDLTDQDAVAGACTDTTRMIWIETPTNPLLRLIDIAAVSAAVRRRQPILLVVDNTFATPINQRPLDAGADISIQSTTKFIGGHSDLLGGVATTRDKGLLDRLRRIRTLHGATPGALESYLALRGVRTLALRLERSQASAGVLALRLSTHPGVEHVRYPGLPNDPGHALAAAQLGGFGSIISFDVAGGAAHADRLCSRLRLIHHATSLGGVESTIERRAVISGQEHLPPGLVRMSVGIEDIDDLWVDLDRGLGD